MRFSKMVQLAREDLDTTLTYLLPVCYPRSDMEKRAAAEEERQRRLHPDRFQQRPTTRPIPASVYEERYRLQVRPNCWSSCAVISVWLSEAPPGVVHRAVFASCHDEAGWRYHNNILMHFVQCKIAYASQVLQMEAKRAESRIRAEIAREKARERYAAMAANR